MLMVKLADWDRHGAVRVLDTEVGTAVPDPTSRVVHGFVCVANAEVGKSGWAVVAVYAQSGRLMFQVDRRRWDLDVVELVHERSADGSSCSFVVSVGGVSEFETAYASLRLDPVNRADPSFDDLDEELQDIFVWLARMAGKDDWRKSVAAQWSEGFETRP